ncbi:MAG: Mth938-like domain-containing protein, partial [Candidatus Puniceispirillaceae bacterium]
MGDDSDLVTIKTMPSDTDLQIIHGYGDGGFRISGQRFAGAVFVMPRHSISWSPAAPEKLTASAIID